MIFHELFGKCEKLEVKKKMNLIIYHVKMQYTSQYDCIEIFQKCQKLKIICNN